MTRRAGWLVFLVFLISITQLASAAPRKSHTAVLGAAKKVPYSKAGDPSGAAAGEDSLKVRALIVDGVLKEWTTGDAHDVTDRSFVVRRVIRLNDALPISRRKSRLRIPRQVPRQIQQWGPAIGCGSAGRGFWSIKRLGM